MLSLEYMSAVKQWADSEGSPVHLDGARIFNAAEALGVSVGTIAANVTSVQFCLSKVRFVLLLIVELFASAKHDRSMPIMFACHCTAKGAYGQCSKVHSYEHC